MPFKYLPIIPIAYHGRKSHKDCIILLHWDSSPVIFNNWCRKMLDKAEAGDREILQGQFDPFFLNTVNGKVSVTHSCITAHSYCICRSYFPFIKNQSRKMPLTIHRQFGNGVSVSLIPHHPVIHNAYLLSHRSSYLARNRRSLLDPWLIGTGRSLILWPSLIRLT